MTPRACLLVLGCALAACGDRPRAAGIDDVGDLDALVAPTEGGLDASPRAPRMSSYPRADVTVELPFGAPARVTDVNVPAVAGRVDVHLLVDTTGSFDGEIDELQEQLVRTVIPSLRARIPSLTLGVSKFQDVPFPPFGTSSDGPFELLVAQTSDAVRVGSGVAQLDQPLGHGGDRPESWAEALYQVATGEGLRAGSRDLARAFRPWSLPDTGSLPGVGWRDRSTRVVVLITDAPTHEGSAYARHVAGAHTTAQAVAALRRIEARVVGISSAADVRPALEAVAVATGGVAPPVRGLCATGIDGTGRAPSGGVCPLVYDIAPDGTRLSRTAVDGIVRLLEATAYAEVRGVAEDDPNGFVRTIEALRATAAEDVTPPRREDRAPPGALDGVADTFVEVRADTELTFRLHLRNLAVREEEFPQVFFLRVRILAGSLALRDLVVRVIVPEGPKPDAGADADATARHDR